MPMRLALDAGPSPRRWWLPAALLAYLAAFAAGATNWITTLDFDAQQMERMSQTLGNKKVEGSYEVMALIYAHTSAIERVGIEIAAGILFISYCLWSLKTIRVAAIVAFWLISPILLFLVVLNKDTILVFFVLVAAVTLRSKLPLLVRVGIILSMYLFYAKIFRPYYMMIAAVFFIIVVMKRMPILLVAALILVGGAVMVMMPPHAFEMLQSSRDVFNIDRLGRDVVGARTAFGNPYPPDNLFHFVMNYGYAAIRLNVPFFSGVSVRDIYLFANVVLFAFVVIVGFRSDAKTSDNTALFFSHVLVSICFEPDVGSYLRHISSALPYLVPALVVLDRAWATPERAPAALGAARRGARFRLEDRVSKVKG